MDKPQTRKRPALITIICLLALLGIIGVLRNVFFAPGIRAVGGGFRFYFLFQVALVLVASIGLWKMKKWSIYLCILLIVEAQVVMILMGVWGILSLAVFSGLLAILLYYLPQTD